MIVMYGASSDIGRRASALLIDQGQRLRVVSRTPLTLDPRADRVTGDIRNASEQCANARFVVSCAHARYTQQLLASVPRSVEAIVCLGSAWRYSKVPNERAEKVREAEAAFLASGRSGVMLHPTMIYGGSQENNISRVLELLKWSPIFPLPGNGRQKVQPIYVDDVADAIASALQKRWIGPTVAPIAGPRPMEFREMVLQIQQALGVRRPLVSLPIAPFVPIFKALNGLGATKVDTNMFLRMREDVEHPVFWMRDALGVVPREFSVGIRQMVDTLNNPGPDRHSHSP
ncbi:hypothetical protein RPMA_09675 [Tardiphaga alba]|uniref:NADH-ubiquinone oxidoreductase n=1 Tax=Tardiphaga alba TaxID=340268 RepID=A0ABX8A602_9BRAD|nr:hypothetical protein [Tardiphaga alba]QUS39073.1 hypothetical protein RPMA_09675 [Tardiphaga alba]